MTRENGANSATRNPSSNRPGVWTPANVLTKSCFCFFSFVCLFVLFWLHWVFIAARRISLVVVSRGYSSLRYVGFSLRWLLSLRSMGSRHAGFSSCGLWTLERRLSCCGT